MRFRLFLRMKKSASLALWVGGGLDPSAPGCLISFYAERLVRIADSESASHNASADEYAFALVTPSEILNDYCTHSEPARAFDSPIAGLADTAGIPRENDEQYRFQGAAYRGDDRVGRRAWETLGAVCRYCAGFHRLCLSDALSFTSVVADAVVCRHDPAGGTGRCGTAHWGLMRHVDSRLSKQQQTARLGFVACGGAVRADSSAVGCSQTASVLQPESCLLTAAANQSQQPSKKSRRNRI